MRTAPPHWVAVAGRSQLLVARLPPSSSCAAASRACATSRSRAAGSKPARPDASAPSSCSAAATRHGVPCAFAAPASSSFLPNPRRQFDTQATDQGAGARPSGRWRGTPAPLIVSVRMLLVLLRHVDVGVPRGLGRRGRLHAVHEGRRWRLLLLLVLDEEGRRRAVVCRRVGRPKTRGGCCWCWPRATEVAAASCCASTICCWWSRWYWCGCCCMASCCWCGWMPMAA